VATFADIISAVDSIAAFYKPLKIILFGSYAYGTPTDDSDVDLLVLKNFTGTPHEQFVEIHKTLSVTFPLDLLVRQPQLVRERIAMNDFFLQEVIEKGLVMYDAADARMGSKGRKRLGRHLDAAALAEAKPVRSDLLPLPAVR